jgi:hypothetical protein
MDKGQVRGGRSLRGGCGDFAMSGQLRTRQSASHQRPTLQYSVTAGILYLLRHRRQLRPHGRVAKSFASLLNRQELGHGG